MLNFLFLMLVPTFIAMTALALGKFVFKGAVCWWEFALILAVPALAVVLGFTCAYWGRVLDTEVWNGQVTGREQVTVPCSHSYDCNCSSDSKGNRHCSTCYEHLHDYDWDVHASTGETVSIARIDPQGRNMPPRFAQVYIGEPFSSRHYFTNYILANPESVLLGSKGDTERFAKFIPAYPDDVYDYYRHDPVINMGVPNVDVKTWNWLFREANKTLGPMKQVNVIVLLVPTNDRNYMLALKDAWVGGKKNDVVVAIGSVDGHKIEWADVLSWTPKTDYKIALKNRIEDIGSLDLRDAIRDAVYTTTVQKFERMHMKDMKYLMRSFQPSATAMWVIFIISTILSLGLAVWSLMNQFTEGNPQGRPRYRGYGYSKY